MENTLTARIAGPADAVAIIPMMVAFNAFESIAWTEQRGAPALDTLLRDRSLGVLALLEDGARTVGYFVVTWGFDLEWNGRDCFLTELFLVEDARGQGRGRAALAHAERIATEHGARALHLMVRNDNELAKNLYVRAGYVSPPRLFLSKVLAG